MPKATTPRTFKLGGKPMTGDDVKEWQDTVKQKFKVIGIDCPIVSDGIYAAATRSYSASLLEALGIISKKAMANGVTPELRIKVRKNQRTASELARAKGKDIQDYRAKLKTRWHPEAKVAKPVASILADSWGFHPPVHDGLDVICRPDAVIFAMVKCKVVDVRSTGWWGKGAPADPELKAKGDGIIQVEVLETVGPFKKGYHICYGHAEKARVKVGDVVKAGQALGHAGFANAWHIHLMYNDGTVGTRGVGNRDPKPIVDYAVSNS